MKRLGFLFILICIQSANAQKNMDSRYEIKTAPIALLAAWLTLDGTYLINSQWAAGPSYISYANRSEYGNMLTPTFYGNAYGVHTIWAVDSLFEDSWYISAHAYTESYRSRPHGLSGAEDNVTGNRANLVLGYRQLNGNFLTMVGLGYELRNHDVKSLKSSYDPVYTEFSRDSSWFTAEFKAGWMF